MSEDQLNKEPNQVGLQLLVKYIFVPIPLVHERIWPFGLRAEHERHMDISIAELGQLYHLNIERGELRVIDQRGRKSGDSRIKM